MRKLAIGLGIVALIGAIFWWMIGSDWRRLITNLPTDAEVLFWTEGQRDAGFRMLDEVPILVASRDIPALGTVRPLETGSELSLPIDVDAYMKEQRHASLVVVQDGVVRLERYGLEFEDDGRWTSFSVAKSLTSTLVGIALKDGDIESLDDPVSKYISGLENSAYDDVTVEQLLTMSSGVAWDETYTDPN